MMAEKQFVKDKPSAAFNFAPNLRVATPTPDAMTLDLAPMSAPRVGHRFEDIAVMPETPGTASALPYDQAKTNVPSESDEKKGKPPKTASTAQPPEKKVELLAPTDFKKEGPSTDGTYVMSIGNSHKVILKVSPEIPSKRAPIAHQFLPGIKPREYDILRLVVGPGVSISFEGFPKGKWYLPGVDHPSVEIYRVQDVALVPRQGERIQPAGFMGMQTFTPDLESGLLRASEFGDKPTFSVTRRLDGLDIGHLKTDRSVEIRIPNLSEKARFAYELVAGNYFAGENDPRGWDVIRIVKTPATTVTLVGSSTAPINPQIKVYEVPSITQVPAQASPIDESKFDKYELKSLPARFTISTSETLAMAAIDAGIGAIPIVSDLVDAAEFVYGIVTGYDRWGRPLTETDLTVMGMAVVIPFGSAGLARGAENLGKALGRDADDVQDLIRGIEHLSEEDKKLATGLAEKVERGTTFDEKDFADAKRLAQKIEAGSKKAEESAEAAAKGGKAEEAQAKSDLKKPEAIKVPKDQSVVMGAGDIAYVTPRNVIKEGTKIVSGRELYEEIETATKSSSLKKLAATYRKFPQETRLGELDDREKKQLSDELHAILKTFEKETGVKARVVTKHEAELLTGKDNPASFRGRSGELTLTEELDELLSKDPLKYRDELTHEIAAYHTLKPQPDGSWLTKETASGLNAITLLELVIKDGARDSNLASLKKILTGASSGK